MLNKAALKIIALPLVATLLMGAAFTAGSRLYQLIVADMNGQVWSTSDFNFSRSPATPSSLSAGSQVITLTDCPRGLTTKNHYVWIAGTGTPERAQITAVACTANAASGTITVTVANTHSAGYTVQSASSGLKEASEWALQVRTTPAYTAGGFVAVPPRAKLILHGTVYITAYNQTIDFQNAEVDVDAVYATDGCGLQAGDTTGAGGVNNVGLKLLNLTGLKPTVPGAGGVCLNGQGTYIDTLSSLFGNTGNYWEHLLVVLNDQSAHVGRFVGYANGGGAYFQGNCTITDCSSMIYGPGGGSSGILHVDEINMTLSNRANGIDWGNLNTLVIDHAIIQNVAQWVIRTSETFADTPNVRIGSLYSEGSFGTNPTGLGGACMILQSGYTSIGDAICSAALPKYTNTGSNSGVTYYYYVVPKDISSFAGPALLAGYTQSTGVGTVTMKWYGISPSGSYDIIRWSQSGLLGGPTTTGCTGGSTLNCGSVATALSDAVVCDPTTHVCTFTDDLSVATTAYTVPNVVFGPKIDFWPGPFVISPRTGSTTNTSNAKLLLTNYSGGNSLTGAVISAFGAQNPSVIAQRCNGGIGLGVSGVVCLAYGSGQSGSLWLPAQVNGGTSQQGRISFVIPPGQNLQSTDLITFKSADPGLTVASIFTRPAWLSGDSALGWTSGGTGGMFTRDAISISNYINVIPDSVSWVENVTSALKSFKVALKIFATAAPTGAAGYGNLWFDTTALRMEMKNGSNTALQIGNFKDTLSCGTTTTCANTVVSNPQIVIGTVPLSGGTATVTGITAFTSGTSYTCTATDQAAITSAVQCVRASSSSITLTGTGTDIVHYQLIGN